MESFKSSFLRDAERLIPELLFSDTFPIERIAAREEHPEDVEIWRHKRSTVQSQDSDSKKPESNDASDSKEDSMHESTTPTNTSDIPSISTTQRDLFNDFIRSMTAYEPDIYSDSYMYYPFASSLQPLRGVSMFESMLGELSEPLPPLVDVAVVPTAEQLAAGTTNFKADTKVDICAICQDDMNAEQDLTRLNKCNHTYHAGCITPWFTEHTTCPTCRKDIRADDAPVSEPAAPQVPLITINELLNIMSGQLPPTSNVFLTMVSSLHSQPQPPRRSPHDSDVD